MATIPTDMNSSMRAVPDALAELLKSSQNIQQISDYCKQLGQAQVPVEEKVRQTADYVKASLVNVSYHVHAVSLQLTNFLQLQANEIEKIDLSLRMITEVFCFTCYSHFKKVKASKEFMGAVGMQAITEPRNYKEREKSKKIPGFLFRNVLPNFSGFDTSENVKPVRSILNLKSLENVGVIISDPAILGKSDSSGTPRGPAPLAAPKTGMVIFTNFLD